MYHYNGAQRYEEFLQVNRLDWALILLGSACYLSSTYVYVVFMVLFIFKFVTFFRIFTFSELSLVGLALDPVD